MNFLKLCFNKEDYKTKGEENGIQNNQSIFNEEDNTKNGKITQEDILSNKLLQEKFIDEPEIEYKHKEMGPMTPQENMIFLLNLISVDNYTEIKNKIFNFLDINFEENEGICADGLSSKAIKDKMYIEIYSKLSMDINEYIKKKINDDKTLFRKTIINNCNQIFHNKLEIIEGNEDKIKSDFLGTTNYIIYLIKVGILRKKVGLDCIESLLERYEQSSTEKEKEIYLESMLLILNKFGQCIYTSKKKNYIEKLNELIDKRMIKIKIGRASCRERV